MTSSINSQDSGDDNENTAVRSFITESKDDDNNNTSEESILTRKEKRPSSVKEEDVIVFTPWVITRVVVATFLSLEEELAFLSIIIAWGYQQILRLRRAVYSLSPKCAVVGGLCGSLTWGVKSQFSSVTAYLSEAIRSADFYKKTPHLLKRWPHSLEPYYNKAQKSWVHNGPSMTWKSSLNNLYPAIWSLRFLFYDSLVSNCTVSKTLSFPNYVAAGLVAEVACKSVIHPVVGIYDHMRGVGQRKQFITAFTGHPSIAVEAMHSGIVLGTWGYSFDCCGTGSSRIIGGALGGVIGTIAATCFVHPIRQFINRVRLERTIDSHIIRYNPSAFLPVTELLAFRLPQAALMFLSLSTAGHFLYPNRQLRSPERVVLSKYGEPMPSSDGDIHIAVYAGATVPDKQSYEFREKRIAELRKN